MITGSEEESRALMMNAAMQVVAKYGFEGFTTKKWAASAGVAEGSLYYHFKSKDDLLDDTFIYVDHQIADLYQDVREVYREIHDIRTLYEFVMDGWQRFFGFLVQNPETTLFYYRYRTSPRYNQEMQKTQFSYFGDFMNQIDQINMLTEDKSSVDWDILWAYILDTTLTFAFRIVTGGIKESEEAVEQMSSLFMKGLMGMIPETKELHPGDL